MKRNLIPVLALALTLGLGAPAVSFAAVPATPVDLTSAAENAVNSVVYIKVTTNSRTQTIEYSDPFEDFFGDFFGRGNGGSRQRRQMETPKRSGAGSGVILTSDGYIVTNNHVVQDADELTVKLNDNREFKARIIGTDKTTDLALIKIEATNLKPITVANSDNLKLGEWVLAIGNPFSLTSTVTAGINILALFLLGINIGRNILSHNAKQGPLNRTILLQVINYLVHDARRDGKTITSVGTCLRINHRIDTHQFTLRIDKSAT